MWQMIKDKNTPIYISIMETILKAIQNGELQPGERLPSERKLAEMLQVNRSTVVHALDELVALGWIVRKRGSGTRVNEGKWGVMTAPRTDWRRYLEQNAFNQRNPFLEKIEAAAKQPNSKIIDAYTGELPLDLIPSFDFPSLSWKQFLAEEQQDELGYLPLRQAISGVTKKEYDLKIPAESLLITSGAQQALFLILQVLLHSGDSVAIEDPSFLYSLPIFQAAGIRLFGVKMDHDGIDLSQLEQTILQHRVKMVMVNPSFQNPTGTVMSLKRRHELVALCQKYQIPILEDDVFGQLSFIDLAAIPPLKKLDPENVLYIGSLSKLLGSTTKIGWLSAPASVNRQLAQARKMMDVSLSIFPQLLATLALQDPQFTTKIQTLNTQVEQRAEKIWRLIQQMPEWEATKPTGGFYSWLRWKQGPLKQTDWELFLQEGLLVAPGFLFGEQQDCLRVNYSRIHPDQAVDFAERLQLISDKIAEKKE
jgi:GntR family transcriptional regulator of abcA and norABC